MTRCIRYLSGSYLKYILICALIFGAGSAVGSQLLGISFFDSYYMSLPLMISLFLVLYSITLSTYQLELSLSMGGRRIDYFAAVLVIWLAATLFSLAVTILAAMIPDWLGWGVIDFPDALGWEDQFRTGAPFYRSPAVWPMLCLLYLMLQSFGTMMGRFLLGHKVLAGVFTAVFLILITALLCFAMIARSLELQTDWVFSLPALCLILMVLILLFTILFHRQLRRAVVR